MSQVIENRVDLNGMSYAERLASGTTVVVAAGANTKGIRVALAVAEAGPGTACVYINGTNVIARAQPDMCCMVTNVFVPPGVDLSLYSNTSTSAVAYVWYKVVT